MMGEADVNRVPPKDRFKSYPVVPVKVTLVGNRV